MNRIITLLLITLMSTQSTFALEAPFDVNGDGIIRVASFGDSITYGIGDNTPSGIEVTELNLTDGSAGYPPRVAASTGLSVLNMGEPGEDFLNEGTHRVVEVIFATSPDYIVIFEGANDAGQKVSTNDYRRDMQKAVNAAHALGVIPIIATIPRTCCNHAGHIPFINAFNSTLKTLATRNQIAIADLAFAWETTCQNPQACELWNLPDGLHPNTLGYDVIGQTVSATLFGVNIFNPAEAAEFEETLGQEPGTTIVKPDPALAATEG
jgi:lysophospholipase L1-like esterase